MTDRQAKIIGIEIAWRKALKSPVFPVPHGSDNFDNIFAQIDAHVRQSFEDSATRVMVNALQREMLRDMRRKQYLKVAIITVALATVILFVSFKWIGK